MHMEVRGPIKLYVALLKAGIYQRRSIARRTVYNGNVTVNDRVIDNPDHVVDRGATLKVAGFVVEVV